MIPIFPSFKKLELSDKDAVQAMTKAFPSYSDFNFVSLYSWNVYDAAEISNLNNNLVIHFNDYGSGLPFFTILGTNETDSAIRQIVAHAKNIKEDDELTLVPDVVIQSLTEQNSFLIFEDRDNHDYIYSVQDMAKFETKNYGVKRNLLNRFERNYGEHATSQIVDVSDVTIRKGIDDLVLKWLENKNIPISEIEHEIKAIRRCLDSASTLESHAYCTFVENEIVAFILFEYLPREMVNVHFCKANTDFVGVYENVYHSIAKYLEQKGIKEINIEQDLGIEGLRKSKTAYNPVYFLKKYRVKLKTN